MEVPAERRTLDIANDLRMYLAGWRPNHERYYPNQEGMLVHNLQHLRERLRRAMCSVDRYDGTEQNAHLVDKEWKLFVAFAKSRTQ